MYSLGWDTEREGHEKCIDEECVLEECKRLFEMLLLRLIVEERLLLQLMCEELVNDGL